MILELAEVKTLKGSLDGVAKRAVMLREHGFEVVNTLTYRSFPNFWKRVYVVRLERPLIMDVNEIVVVPPMKDIIERCK